jgi:hypothetical protein
MLVYSHLQQLEQLEHLTHKLHLLAIDFGAGAEFELHRHRFLGGDGVGQQMAEMRQHHVERVAVEPDALLGPFDVGDFDLLVGHERRCQILEPRQPRDDALCCFLAGVVIVGRGFVAGALLIGVEALAVEGVGVCRAVEPAELATPLVGFEIHGDEGGIDWVRDIDGLGHGAQIFIGGHNHRLLVLPLACCCPCRAARRMLFAAGSGDKIVG